MPVRGAFSGPIPSPDPSRPIDPRLDRLAWWLEQAFGIPGTRIRFGLDAIAGLLPGIGDAGGLIVGVILLGAGYHYRVPPRILLRMTSNLGVDALVGVVPVLGDLFDVAWKANTRNIMLLRAHAGQARSSRGYWITLGIVLAGVAAILGLLALVALWVLAWILQHPF